MKKTITLISTMFACITMQAQTYSIAVDGTTWQYVYTSISSFSIDYNFIDGDTVANGHHYKKVYTYPQYNRKKATFYCAFREENDKIYALQSGDNMHLPEVNGESLLYDFSLNEGDQFGDHYLVDKVDYIEIDGKQRKRITFHDFDTWVEGIGSLERKFGSPLAELPNNGSYTKLEMFEQEEQIIYGERRFNLLTDGVHWTERMSTENGPEPEELNPYFDLEIFYVKGDTTINNTIYKKIYRNEYPYMNLRESSDGKIYYYTGNEDCLLYDFGWKKISGEPFKYENYDREEAVFQVDDNYYSNLEDGHMYEYVQVKYAPFTLYSHTKDTRLYIGLGLNSGVFSHLYLGDLDCYCFKDLVSVYNSENKLIYQNPLFTESGEIVTGISSVNTDSNLSILTQRGETIFKLNNFTDTYDTVLFIYDSKGQQISVRNINEGTVTIRNLPTGLYLYRLETDNRLSENGKFMIHN